MRRDGTYEMKDVLSEEDVAKVNKGADAKGRTVNYVKIGRHLRCVSASYSGKKS
jgi:hypothetical protein